MNSLSTPAEYGFRGNLDGVALYSRALSPAEIAHLYTGTRSTGEFLSRKITLSKPAYSVSALADEGVSGRTKLEISFDGETWCDINGELNDPHCSYPASQIWYRANLKDITQLASVQLDLGCTARCIDYDNDGYTAIASNAPFCSGAQLDCNDQNSFQAPNMASGSCNCSGAAPTAEICNDGIDNDCDGAIDNDDNDCYSAGTIYYVSNSTGCDSNAGTDPKAPIKSLALAQSILNSGIHPGDKILLRRGDTWTDETLTVSTHATAELPLYIGTYGFGERAHLHFTTPQTALYLNAASHVTIDGLHVTRSAKTIVVNGVGFNPQSISTDVTLRDIQLDGLAYGLSVYATNFILENSIINDNENSQIASSHAQGLWVYSGSENGIVRNNIFRNNGKLGDIFDHNIYLGGGNNWLFEGNDFSGNSGTSIVFHGVQDGHIIRNNSFHDCTHAPAIDISAYATGQYLQNFVVERNRIYNNSPGAFWIIGAVNLQIRNNLFYNNGSVFNMGSGIDNQASMLVTHNTFYNNGGSSYPSGGVYTQIGNLYSSTPNDGGGLTVTANSFVDAANGDLNLVAGSPAIDTASASSLTTDYFDHVRPVDGDGNGSVLPDYGAIEFYP